jgi:hypothetical protein
MPTESSIPVASSMESSVPAVVPTGLRSGAIVAITIGTIVFVCCITVLLFLVVRLRRRRLRHGETSAQSLGEIFLELQPAKAYA